MSEEPGGDGDVRRDPVYPAEGEFDVRDFFSPGPASRPQGSEPRELVRIARPSLVDGRRFPSAAISKCESVTGFSQSGLP